LNYFSTWALCISSLWAIGNITYFPSIITHLLLCYSSLILAIFSFPISNTILNWTFSLYFPSHRRHTYYLPSGFFFIQRGHFSSHLDDIR
jgi:hypothetical protein